MKRGKKKSSPKKPQPKQFQPEILIYPNSQNQFTSHQINQMLCNNFGYIYDIQGKLVSPDTQSTYIFGNDYQYIGQFTGMYIQCKLKQQFNLLQIWIPESEQQCNIFISEDFYSNREKCLILIQGKGKVSPAQWSRRICINDSLQLGTAFQYIRSAKQLGYSIVILNPNYNRHPISRQLIRENYDMQAHCQFVWENFIRQSPARNLVIVAHSCGGRCTVGLLKNNSREFMRRVKAIAFLDSVHKVVSDLAFEERKYFQKVAKNWQRSKLQIGRVIQRAEVAQNGCLNVSAGVPQHELTCSYAFQEVFPYLEQKLSVPKRGVRK